MMIDKFTLMTHQIWNRAIDASFNMEARRFGIAFVCHLCAYYVCVIWTQSITNWQNSLLPFSYDCNETA